MKECLDAIRSIQLAPTAICAAPLAEYVDRGGAILVTGRTSLYNDWRRRRADFALAPVLGVHYPPARLPPPARHEFGRGRAAYLPPIESVDKIPGIGDISTTSLIAGSGF